MCAVKKRKEKKNEVEKKKKEIKEITNFTVFTLVITLKNKDMKFPYFLMMFFFLIQGKQKFYNI